jgi:hypothetical protein
MIKDKHKKYELNLIYNNLSNIITVNDHIKNKKEVHAWGKKEKITSTYIKKYGQNLCAFL